MAQEKKFIKGFSGGMMLHTGYLSGGDNPRDYNPSGATFGIGGVVRLHLIHMSEHQSVVEWRLHIICLKAVVMIGFQSRMHS